MKSWCLIATLMLVAAPSSASAQIFLSPFVDTTLTSPSAAGGGSQPGFGVSFGKIGAILGSETEVGYHPEIVGNDANSLAKTRVLTISESLMVGPVIGKAKPYGVIGAGDLLLNVSSKSVAAPGIDSLTDSLSKNYFTIDVGGGLMYFFRKRIAARGDLRYFRAYGLDLGDLEDAASSGGLNLKFNHFTFWRAGFGVTFTFG
jgi:opacity protein-like surface antigen